MSPRWSKPSVRSPRAMGVGLVTALVAGTLALAFGTGYVANKAVFNGSSAWLAKGDDVTLVSSSGGTPQQQVDDVPAGDITMDANGSFQVESSPDDATSSGGTGAGKTTVRHYGQDGSGELAGQITGGPNATVVTGGDAGWLVDPDAATVQAIDPATYEPSGKPVKVPGGIAGQAVTGEGQLWVLSRDGRVARVDGRSLVDRHRLDLDDPATAQLAVVGERAVVVDPAGGRILVVGGRTEAVSALDGAQVLLAPVQPGSTLVLAAVDGDRRTIVALDLDGGSPMTRRVSAEAIAAPLPAAGGVYVPAVEGKAQKLLHLTLPDLTDQPEVALPTTSGSSADAKDGDLGYEAFLVGTRLWANDARSVQAVTVGDDGEPATINKTNPETSDVRGDQADQEKRDAEARRKAAEAAAAEAELEAEALPPITPGSGGLTPGPGPGTGAGTPGPGGGGTGAPANPLTPGTTTTIPAADPPLVEVPDLVDQDQADACAELGDLGLRCATNPIDDRNAPENQVSEQSPTDGTKVEQGSSVTITYAVRGTVTIPRDLRDSARAQARLEAAGLVVEPTRRTDARNTDQLNTVIAASLDPAPGTKVKVGSTVTFEYFSDYAPIPYNPSPVLGQPQDQACPYFGGAGFPNCTVVPDRVATNRGQIGTVESVEPGAGGEQKPNIAITVHVYGSVAARETRAFVNCTDANAWAVDAGVVITCSDPLDGPPGAVGAVTQQDPPIGTAVGGGDQVVLHHYQPAPIPVADWTRISSNTAAHLFKANGAPAPEPSDWSPTGVIRNFLAGPEGGAAAPLTCYVSTSYGSTGFGRYLCNLSAGVPGFQGGWSPVDLGGTLYAWGADPGGAVPLTSCELRRTDTEGANRGAVVFLAQQYSGGGCPSADPGPSGYFDEWVANGTMWILP